MELTRDDFVAWKNDPCTQKLFKDIVTQMDDYLAQLINSAGLNSSEDRRVCGKLEGLRFPIDWEPILDIEENEDATSRGSPGTS